MQNKEKQINKNAEDMGSQLVRTRDFSLFKQASLLSQQQQYNFRGKKCFETQKFFLF